MSLNSSKMIAVVDDDPEMRMLLRDFLTSQGYQVEIFSSSTGALKALEGRDESEKAQRFAAVLSDINMAGGINGIDLLKLIKQQHPKLPVLLITAYGTKEQEVVAKKAGAFDFLTKPFPLSRLADSLQQALRSVPI